MTGNFIMLQKDDLREAAVSGGVKQDLNFLPRN